MTAGTDEVPPGVIAPLVTFYFGPEHVQLPMEEILIGSVAIRSFA